MAPGWADTVFLQSRFLLAGFDGCDAAFHRAHTVQIFVELLLISPGQGATQITSTPEHAVEHLTVQWVGLGGSGVLTAFSEKPVQDIAGIGLGGHGLCGRSETTVIVVAFMQTLLILLPGLWHGGQLKRGEQGLSTYIVGHDLIRRNGNVDAIARVGVG